MLLNHYKDQVLLQLLLNNLKYLTILDQMVVVVMVEVKREVAAQLVEVEKVVVVANYESIPNV